MTTFCLFQSSVFEKFRSRSLFETYELFVSWMHARFSDQLQYRYIGAVQRDVAMQYDASDVEHLFGTTNLLLQPFKPGGVGKPIFNTRGLDLIAPALWDVAQSPAYARGSFWSSFWSSFFAVPASKK